MTWTTLPRSERYGALAVHRTGSGADDLVLIHGVGLRSEAWGAMLPLLASRFRVHAIDMPGHGESAPAAGDGLDDFVAPFHAALDNLDGRCFLAGHSMGALIALRLAADRPERVAGVAALNAVFRRTPQAAAAVRERAAALCGRDTPDPTPTLERWFGRAPSGAVAAAARACHEWLVTGDPTAYAAAYGVFAREDGPSPETLAGLRCPALFLTGSDEPNSTPAMSRAMAALAADGSVAIVDGAAHMAPMTHADQVAASLLDHFASAETRHA